MKCFLISVFMTVSVTLVPLEMLNLQLCIIFFVKDAADFSRGVTLACTSKDACIKQFFTFYLPYICGNECVNVYACIALGEGRMSLCMRSWALCKICQR